MADEWRVWYRVRNREGGIYFALYSRESDWRQAAQAWQWQGQPHGSGSVSHAGLDALVARFAKREASHWQRFPTGEVVDTPVLVKAFRQLQKRGMADGGDYPEHV